MQPGHHGQGPALRIAVTGAAGYIGGHLTRALAARGHQVQPQDVRPGADDTFDLLEDGARRWQWLAAGRPDLVIHLAAKYGRIWGEDGLAHTVAMNTGLTSELARDCGLQGIRLLYVSSSEVYGEAAMAGPEPVPEDVPLEPLNMYGLSKKWGEEACRAYAPDGLAVVRLNMPYGPAAQVPGDGVIPRHSGRVGPRGYNALHTMLWQAHHGMPITVHKGTERCFTWIEDAIRAVAVIAESGQAGTWNACRSDDHVVMTDLAWQCQALSGRLSEIIEKEPDARITPVKRLNNSRLLALGWQPKVSLDTGMLRTLEYVRHFDREARWVA